VNIDLVASRKWLYLVSGALVAISLVLLAIPPALRPGIEFTAGTTTQIRFRQPVTEEQLRSVYASLDHGEARIQAVSPTEYLIRTRELQVPPGSFTIPATQADQPLGTVGPVPVTAVGSATVGAKGATGKVPLRLLTKAPCDFGGNAAEVDAGTKVDVLQIETSCSDGAHYLVAVPSTSTGGWVRAADTQNYVAAKSNEPAQDQGERTIIENAIRGQLGDFDVLEFATVSPTVSRVAVRNAAIALGVATVFILIYIAIAFASVPSPVRYGTCAVVAMLHDVIVTLGFFSLFGKVFGIEVNLMFVTGLLTVIGFSVHDTIVIYDRIRENIRQAPNASLHENVNAAILQTIARSLNTSLTVLITVASMLALGGASIQSFLLVILIGITAGAYSSIGIAAQLLVSWETGELARLAFWRRAAPAAEQAG